MYPEIQKRIDSVMVNKGVNSHSWITRYFPGENHSELAWSKRLRIPLEFLLSSPAQP
ncbi:MAG: hypothetical protein WBJ36_00825 [Tenuifilum sp.]|jgi:hypothetical protein|uniref:hypothetical protein n=1 Tax=Tenuifilum sp. TaxID=2760880 RepID=UPI003C9A9AFA